MNVKDIVNQGVSAAQRRLGYAVDAQKKLIARGAFLAAAFVTACGCATPATQVVTGTVRAPIAPSEVKIYLRPPPTFEEVAMLDASSHSVFGTGGQKSIDTVIERLKEKAAKLGANGVILEGFADSQSGSIGAGGGSDSYSRGSAVGVGVGGSLGIYKKTGRGEAIFVPANAALGAAPPVTPAPPSSQP